MAVILWKNLTGDWAQGANWTGEAAPGAGDVASFGGGGYVVTLAGSTALSGLVFNAPGSLLYLTGVLGVSGTTTLQAGTLALAFGTLQGGTLALAGGVLGASGGTLAATGVQGVLDLSAAYARLFLRDGVAFAGAGGSGRGSIALTGAYAGLVFQGAQTLANATVALGSTPPGINQGGPAALLVARQGTGSSAATLTLAADAWLRQAGTQGQVIVGAVGPGAVPAGDLLVNLGTITAGGLGGTLALLGAGTLVNRGTITVSGGGTLSLATAGFTNTGTLLVTNGVLDLGGTFAASRLSALGPLSLSQGRVRIGGTAQNSSGTLSFSAAGPLGAVTLGGTIAGGTVVNAGGGLDFSADTGVLDGVTYQGGLTLGAGAAVTLANGARLLGATGGAGTASIGGDGAALLLRGTIGLDNATLSLGAATGMAAISTTDPLLAASATTATLGARVVLTHAARNASVLAGATSPVPGLGLTDTLVSQGTILAGLAGGTLTLGGAGAILNQGQIAVGNGDRLVVDAGSFTNAGGLSVGAGATAVLGGPADAFGQSPAWVNTGSIALSGGALVLAGSARTAQLGSIAASAGSTIQLTGTLDNSGATLALGTALPTLTVSGTLLGGRVNDTGGRLSFLGPAAVLDGVTLGGALNLGAGQTLKARNGLTLLGGGAVGGTLGFLGSQVFDKGSVSLTGTLDLAHDFQAGGQATLTLGPGMTLTTAGNAALGAANDLPGDAIVNFGRIGGAGTLTLGGGAFANAGSIAIAGGTLAIAAGAFSNSGSIAVADGALSLGGSVALGGLGRLSLRNAAVGVSGTLDATGGTLALGAGTSWGRLALTGTLRGGTVVDAGQGLSAGGRATLDGVTWRGALDLGRPFQQVSVVNGLTLLDAGGTNPGTLVLTGPASRVTVLGSTTIDRATLLLGSGGTTYLGQRIGPAVLAAAGASTLTLGAGALLQAAGPAAQLGDAAGGGWTDAVVNAGTIQTAVRGGLLTIGASQFLNTGTLALSGGANALFAGAGFSNAGVVSVAAGSQLMVGLLGYYAAPVAPAAPLTNTGTIALAGGVVSEVTGGGIFPLAPIANAAGAVITGFGGVAAPVVNAGTIEAQGGAQGGSRLALSQGVSGGGTLVLSAGTMLELGGVVSGQTIACSPGADTLRILQPGAFDARVVGFGTGDTIDLGTTSVFNAAISLGTLVLSTPNGPFRLATSAPLGGALAVGRNTIGGSAVTYTAQAGTVATISVTQSRMAFWASPAGDVFKGQVGLLSGAQIGNWNTNCSLSVTDIVGSRTRVSYAQASGLGTITVTDGVQTAAVTLIGSYNANWFQVAADPNGGAAITYAKGG